MHRRFPVVADPIQLGAMPQQILRRLPLSAATSIPESAGNLVRRWRRLERAVLLDAIQESERGGLPDGCPRPTLKQPARGFPLREHHRV
jgi:hypothetical protein